MKTIKYTKEQENELISNYKSFSLEDFDGRDIYVKEFMVKHNKTKASVIGKLSKLKIHIGRPKLSKITGNTPETKAAILQKIANALGLDKTKLAGIDKSPKLSLQNLLDRVIDLVHK